MAALGETKRLWATPLVLQIALVWLVGFGAVSPASAQAPQQNAMARSLFEEGVALADQHDWVAAADRFSRAYSLKPTSGIAFNWASVLVESGKLLEAQDLLFGVLRDPAADTQIRADSDAMLAALAGRIAHLRVHVEGVADERTQLEVDGQLWPRAAWDIASPIDPGAHSVVLKSAQAEGARADLSLADGESRDISLALRVPEPEPEPGPRLIAPQPSSPTPVDEPRQPLYRSWKLWTVVGAVAVAGAVTAVLLTTKKDAKDEQPVPGNTTPGVLRW
ncbi:MAG: hypothetical protein JWN48_2162 [Myxococcaceae bacterium]|nr:hypothetical protein [Myxococcaceae bacterium]